MKKFLAVLVVVVLVSSLSSAQDIWGSGKMRAGVGGYFVLPTGTWGDAYGIGFGGFGKFEYGLNEDMALQASVGYMLWGEKDNAGVKSSANALPIDVAFKYNLSSVTPGFYAVASLGLWSINQKVTTPSVSLGGFTFAGGTIESSQTKDILAIGAGYDTGMLDFNLRYSLNGNFNNLIVTAAYNFGL